MLSCFPKTLSNNPFFTSSDFGFVGCCGFFCFVLFFKYLFGLIIFKNKSIIQLYSCYTENPDTVAAG